MTKMSAGSLVCDPKPAAWITLRWKKPAQLNGSTIAGYRIWRADVTDETGECAAHRIYSVLIDRMVMQEPECRDSQNGEFGVRILALQMQCTLRKVSSPI